MKIDQYFRQRRCRKYRSILKHRSIAYPVTLVYGNIWFMFSGQGASNDSGVVENMDCQDFRTLRLRHLRKWGQHHYIILFSPLSPYHWSQNTWPWMTLNGLNGNFTLHFHYYELTLSNYLLPIYCRVCLHIMWPAEQCVKLSSGLWSAEYLESEENCGIFSRCYIVGTLTNKINIIT